MTTVRGAGGRRWFLRLMTGTALSVVAMGAHALFGAPTAAAQASGTCCSLFLHHTSWCPMLCRELNHNLRCWSCNNNRCRCCECTLGANCFRYITACSYQQGCCER